MGAAQEIATTTKRQKKKKKKKKELQNKGTRILLP